jgi:hypothetical protein
MARFMVIDDKIEGRVAVLDRRDGSVFLQGDFGFNRAFARAVGVDFPFAAAFPLQHFAVDRLLSPRLVAMDVTEARELSQIVPDRVALDMSKSNEQLDLEDLMRILENYAFIHRDGQLIFKGYGNMIAKDFFPVSPSDPVYPYAQKIARACDRALRAAMTDAQIRYSEWLHRLARESYGH